LIAFLVFLERQIGCNRQQESPEVRGQVPTDGYGNPEFHAIASKAPSKASKERG
jgi:hypothetical protein